MSLLQCSSAGAGKRGDTETTLRGEKGGGALCALDPWVNKALFASARGACSDVVGGFIQEVIAALLLEAQRREMLQKRSGGSCCGVALEPQRRELLEKRSGGSCC